MAVKHLFEGADGLGKKALIAVGDILPLSRHGCRLEETVEHCVKDTAGGEMLRGITFPDLLRFAKVTSRLVVV